MSGELVEPAYHWCPPYRDTLGAQVAKLAAAAGFAPDVEQALLLDDMTREDQADVVHAARVFFKHYGDIFRALPTSGGSSCN